MKSGCEAGPGLTRLHPQHSRRTAQRIVFRHYTFVDYATQAYMALVGVLILLFHNHTVPHWAWLFTAHALGLLAVHFLIQLADANGYVAARLRPQPSAQPLPPLLGFLQFIRHFYPVPLYLWFFSETGWLNRMFFHQYLDPLAISWDEKLFGFQPSVLFMQKLPYLWVSELFYASYFSYYIMIVGVGIALYVRNRQHFFHYVSVVSFVFYICYAIYIILPIIGPRVFFRDLPEYDLPEQYQAFAPNASYPAAVQAGPFFKVMAFIYRVFEAPGAALPSSHVAIALCTVFFSFLYLRPIRYVHLVVAILLCLATVYCRYHYAIDVLTGILTALILVPLAQWLYRTIDKPELTNGRTAAQTSRS